MRLIFSALMMSSLILFPGLGFGQYSYVRECTQTVASQLNVSTLDVAAELGPYASRRDRIVNWQSRRGSDRSGYCEFNTATGELVRTESGPYTGPLANRAGFRGASNGYFRQNLQPIVNFPHVKVDTGGRGNFNGLGKSVRITRGWVDTKGQQTIVALSGKHDFKIDFYGRITQKDGKREFTMEIDNSDRGNAMGTATFLLNDDRNEVQSISLNGNVNGRNFSGNFKRD